MVKKLISFILLLFLPLTPLPAVAEQLINATTSFPGSVMPTAERNRLAHSILGNRWLRDPEVTQYFNYVNSLLSDKDDYFFTLVNARQVNAFAFVGGLIVVYSGLWVTSNTEDELLSVMAHEMGHIKLDHLNKSKQNNKEAALIAVPLLLATILSKNSEVTEAIIASSSSFLSSDFVAYSRSLEHEADIFALDLMINQQRNAAALLDVYGRFKSNGNEYLSTHPAPKRRSAYILDRLSQTNLPQPPYRPDFYLIKEKLELLQDQGVIFKNSRLKKLNDNTLTPYDKNTLHYGLLLYAIEHYDKTLGETMVNALKDQAHPFIQRAIGEYYITQRRYDDAITLLLQEHEAHPESVAIILELLRAYNISKQYQAIIDIFEILPPTIKQHVGIAIIATNSYQKINIKGNSQQLLAEAYAWDGLYENAFRQISVGEKSKETPTDILLKLGNLKELLKKQQAWAKSLN